MRKPRKPETKTRRPTAGPSGSAAEHPAGVPQAEGEPPPPAEASAGPASEAGLQAGPAIAQREAGIETEIETEAPADGVAASGPAGPDGDLAAHAAVQDVLDAVVAPSAASALPPAGRRKAAREPRPGHAKADDGDQARHAQAPAEPALLPALTPALAVVPQLLLRAQSVKVAFFDVDGVLTDGGLFFSEAGETLKRFNTLDGHGIKLLARAGITPAVVTGRDSPALRHRLAALGIVHVRYGTEDKRPAAEAILQALQLDWSQAAWIGDDWPDLPALRRCAFACAPANAHAEVKAVAHHVTQLAGGQGAAREFCDLLLVASGRYVELLQEYAA